MSETAGSRCSVCGAALRTERITYTQDVGGLVYIIRDVPADVCGQCGERYLTPATVDTIQELVEHGGLDRVAEIKHVPVYQFERA